MPDAIASLAFFLPISADYTPASSAAVRAEKYDAC